jgi:hypothetical protein
MDDGPLGPSKQFFVPARGWARASNTNLDRHLATYYASPASKPIEMAQTSPLIAQALALIGTEFGRWHCCDADTDWHRNGKRRRGKWGETVSNY